MKRINIENRKMFLNYVESTMLDFQQTLKSNLAPSNQIKGVKELIEQLSDIVTTKSLNTNNATKLIKYLDRYIEEDHVNFKKNYDQISRKHIYMYNVLSTYFSWKHTGSDYQITYREVQPIEECGIRLDELMNEHKNKEAQKIINSFNSLEITMLKNIITANNISTYYFIYDNDYINFIFNDIIENAVSSNDMNMKFLMIELCSLQLKYINLRQSDKQILVEYILDFGGKEHV